MVSLIKATTIEDQFDFMPNPSTRHRVRIKPEYILQLKRWADEKRAVDIELVEGALVFTPLDCTVIQSS